MPWPKGKPISPEHKASISAKLRGRPSPTKGTKASAETRAKLSAVRKGRTLSEEHKATLKAARQANAHLYNGRAVSEETRAKLSAKAKGRPPTAAWTEKMRVRMAGTANPMYGKAHTEEHKARLSAVLKGRKLPPEQIERRRQAGLRQAASGEPNIGERNIAAVLDALGIEYEAQKVIGPYCVDFYVAARSLVIECDGDFWHSRPERAARDRKRDGWFKHNGYTVLRIDYTAVRRKAHQTVTAALEALGA